MSVHHTTEAWHGYHEKISSRHLERLAVVYVRQSTMQQVLDHQASTQLQYGLVHRAVALGWSEKRVVVIDDDLGQSGTSVEGRQGFQRLVAEVGLDHVGLVLGIDMSRLARSSKDWHQLLEICALFGTLLADLDGIYAMLNSQSSPTTRWSYCKNSGVSDKARPFNRPKPCSIRYSLR